MLSRYHRAARDRMAGDVNIDLPSNGLTDSGVQRGHVPNYQTFNTSARQLYSSLPLHPDSRSIRLLDLDAPSEKEDRNHGAPTQGQLQLTGRIRVARLDHAPTFTALSYVWGRKAIPSHTISCLSDGNSYCKIEITSNCHAALHKIRKRFRAVTIWIDSICINQSDNIEKAGQIPLMGDIFSTAETVYIWLDEGNDQSVKAINYIKNHAAILPRLPFAWLGASTDKGKRSESLKYWRGVLVEDPFRRILVTVEWLGLTPTKVTKSDIHFLLNNDWIHRSWTFQEVALASNPVILCGNNILLWADLVSAICIPYNSNVDDDVQRGSYLYLSTAKSAATLHAKNDMVLSRWRAIIDFWLTFNRPFPRKTSHLSRPLAVGPSTNSFRNVLQSMFHFPLLLRYIFWTIAISALLALYGYWVYREAKILTDEEPGIPAYLLYFGLCLLWLVSIPWLFPSLEVCSFIISGESTHYFLQKSIPEAEDTNDGKMRALSGIQTALRQRTSSSPQDVAFALFGVILSLVPYLSPPDYEKAPREIFRLLLRDLITWQPYMLAMMIDAGCREPAGDPSWVPDWTRPCPSQWLSFRYSIGSPIRATPLPLNACCTISGNSLKLKGQFNGSIIFQTTFIRMSSREDDEALLTNICAFCDFYCSIWRDIPKIKPYDFPESFLYAVLNGLSPARGPLEERYSHMVDNGSDTRDWETVTEIFPRCRAPYDFSNREADFDVWCRLQSFIDRELAPAGSGVHIDSNHAGVHEIFCKIKEDQEFLAWFMKTTSMISAEKRCLFVLSKWMVGTGPLDLDLDDEIFLLPGVQAPMALRRSAVGEGERFVVIGAALVHGIMRGEGFDSSRLLHITLV